MRVHSLGLQILLLNFFFVLNKLIFSPVRKKPGDVELNG